MAPRPGHAPAPLSVIVPCFNEEAMLPECLASLHFADEILVVDSFSTDKTVGIARSHSARVLQHKFWSHGAQVNWAAPQARHEWLLVVDADERVTPQLAEEICGLLSDPDCDGYWLPRRNYFLGRQIRFGAWGGDRVLRLFHRQRGRYEEKHVHSRVELNGTAGRCRGALLHFSYSTLDDYARKIQRFSRGSALNEFQRGRRAGAWRMFSHAAGRFLKSYVLKLGFLDGTEGLIIALMEFDQAFLKYAKLWEMGRVKPNALPAPVPLPDSSGDSETRDQTGNPRPR